MISVLNEISKLRNSKSISIDYSNTNRYRVVLNESNGTKTAYFFTTPIYNNRTRKAVELKFHKKDGWFYSVGSNSSTTYSKNIRLENAESYCLVNLNNNVSFYSSNKLVCGNGLLSPTTNGFVYKVNCEKGNELSFELEVGKPYMEVRANNKYFSLMSERFRPFVTVSCIGTVNDKGAVIAPAKISYQKLSDRKYRCTISHCSDLGKWIMFEVNLYEEKLVQDTTVESANPKTNNAFGSTAFIGNTLEYGEQWLYSRPDFSKLSDLSDKKIIKAVMHLPKYNQAAPQLTAFRVSARFCSFGSTWDNKIASASSIAESLSGDFYQDIDITSLFTDKFGRLVWSEGIILKPRIKGDGFSAIATGDSYYAPQIYEINYK